MFHFSRSRADFVISGTVRPHALSSDSAVYRISYCTDCFMINFLATNTLIIDLILFIFSVIHVSLMVMWWRDLTKPKH